MLLSVIVAGIHKDNWVACWESINRACSLEWEMVLVSPYDPPKELLDKGNVRAFVDMGAPTRCMQRGLIEAAGDWVMFSWDNGKFELGAIDNIFTILAMYWHEPNYAVCCKYIEGNSEQSEVYMSKKIYYHINHHIDAKSQYILDSYFLFNLGVVNRQTLVNLGGLDCYFEAPAMALVDLAIRMQNSGVNILLQRMVAYREEWNPSGTGTHAPIHNAMVENDVPYYKSIWTTDLHKTRKAIDIDNWKKSPAVWARRFTKLEKN